MADVSKDISDIKVTVQRIESTMVSRPEISDLLKDRVTNDVYVANHNALIERVVRLETNPQKIVPWIASGVSCLGVIISGAGLLFTVILYLITHR